MSLSSHTHGPVVNSTTQEINDHGPSLDEKVAVNVKTSLVDGGHTCAAAIIGVSEATFTHTSEAADVLFLEAANLHISEAGGTSAIAHDDISEDVDAHTSKGADDQTISVMPTSGPPETHSSDVADVPIANVVIGKQTLPKARSKRPHRK